MRFRLLTLSALLFAFIPLQAQTNHKITSEVDSVRHGVEERLEFAFEKKFKCGVSLSLEEEVRFNEIDFNRSNTTFEVGYKPCPYFSFNAGYTLRVLGQKGWTDANEFLRHRTHLALVGQYDFGQWKLSLHEKFVLDSRTDSVNANEKAKNRFTLRSKLMVDYSSRSKPLKPYVAVEFINTLNEPTTYINANTAGREFGQYLMDINTRIGLKYRINKRNTLNFYYRFDYGQHRDVNITKKKGFIELVNRKEYIHTIGIAYELGW